MFSEDQLSDEEIKAAIQAAAMVRDFVLAADIAQRCGWFDACLRCGDQRATEPFGCGGEPDGCTWPETWFLCAACAQEQRLHQQSPVRTWHKTGPGIADWTIVK